MQWQSLLSAIQNVQMKDPVTKVAPALLPTGIAAQILLDYLK